MSIRNEVFATLLALTLLVPSSQFTSAEETSDLPELDMAKALSAPRPDYPYEARRQRLTGTGVVVVEVDTSTGKVTEVRMAPSTGHVLLDNAATQAFRKWRFAPGGPSRLKAPITFTMFGGRVDTEYKVQKKSMDDVLAAFLGKGTVLRGPIPAYPRFPAWTEKSGKGVYELHAGKDGKVESVRILKSSGDTTFDRVAVKTLGKWRLRRGPLILELPLGFTLTPDNYSVQVAR